MNHATHSGQLYGLLGLSWRAAMDRDAQRLDAKHDSPARAAGAPSNPVQRLPFALSRWFATESHRWSSKHPRLRSSSSINLQGKARQRRDAQRRAPRQPPMKLARIHRHRSAIRDLCFIQPRRTTSSNAASERTTQGRQRRGSSHACAHGRCAGADRALGCGYSARRAVGFAPARRARMAWCRSFGFRFV